MKKLIGVILSLIVLSASFAACDSETYTDKLNDEKKAIDKFIKNNGIKVVHDFPEKFEDNVFFKEPKTGVYIHVIKWGDKDKPSKDRRTEVFLRYDSIYNLLNNEAESGAPNWTAEDPFSFKYGDASTYSSSSSVYYASYYFLSQGCVIPLDYDLGNNAEVKLIIPFESGSTSQVSNYKPLYYSRLKYTFVPEVTTED